MTRTIDKLEARRVALQSELDGQKTQADRNRLGQFATPTALARDILRYAGSLIGEREPISFLDPAIGTGSFFSALRAEFPANRIKEAQGFEIDPHYGTPAAELWGGQGLDYHLADFTREQPQPRHNVLICNPPYVRHHHLSNDEKSRLQLLSAQITGRKFSGLAGLYCYFLGLAHAWMSEGGVAGWLIPSEFMDVNYGQAVKRYLLEEVTLLHIHRFDPSDVQFADALVSSAVVWFRKAKPPADHTVKFTFGSSLFEPKIVRHVSARELAREAKWTRFPVADIRAVSTEAVVSDFFRIKRGIATGDNSYFIMSEEEIETRGLPMQAFRPILPSPRYLKTDEVKADGAGVPLLDRRLFLLDPRMTESEIAGRYPALHQYLEEGRSRRLHEGYLCSRRAPWFSQEKRDPAPIVCTYLGRGDAKSGRPFRFILNHSQAIMANVYLGMYPTPALKAGLERDPSLIRRVWQALNRITPEQLLGEGRVYGGGLHKLEPRELSNVPVPEIADILPASFRPAHQSRMFEELVAAE